jgi:hypothetical protein
LIDYSEFVVNSQHSIDMTNPSNGDRPILERLNHLDDRCNRIILVGQSEWVDRLVKSLHLCGIGETILWSPAVPTGQPDQVVRILSRSRM